MKRNLLLSFPKAARLLLATLICLPFWGTALMAQTAQPEAYAVFDSSTGTLTFKYDNSKPADAYPMNTGTNLPGWTEKRYDIKKVVFDPSFAGARPTSCGGWFYGCQDLADIEGISNLNTEKVTDMRYMFSECTSLDSLNLSSFNTENVTDMSYMFYKCRKLASLDLSSFNTGIVTNMGSMFYKCTSLTSLNLSSFNTENVTNMGFMFDTCTSLTSLDLSSFNAENVTTMYFMFNYCTSLTSLDLSSFNTENVTDMGGMFKLCTSLTSLDLSSFNTKKVTDMRSMFDACRKLTSLDLSSFNTEKVTNMSGMFHYCTALTTIYASDKFVTTSVTDGTGMFTDCTALKGAIKYDASKTDHSYANLSNGYFSSKPIIAYAVLDSTTGTLTFKYDNNKPADAYLMNTGTNFPGWNEKRDNIKKVVFDPSFAGARPTSCYGWFAPCRNLADIEGISNLNTENVTDMSYMFSNCTSLDSLDLSSFNTENVTNMSFMFFNCTSLASLDLSSFNTKSVTDMSSMFLLCTSLDSLNLSSFNTENVTDLSGMFCGCTSLTSLDLSSFNTENVTNMSGMFYKCTSLTSLDLSSFNTDSVKSMREMFKDCTALTTIYASDKFVTTSVTDGADMFKCCTALKGAIEYDASKTDHSYANFDGYFRHRMIGTGMYAEFDSAAGVLTFKNGDIHDGDYPVNQGYESPAWLAHSKSICKVVFDPSVAEARPTSCASWFLDCIRLTEIEGLEHLNTDSVTIMRSMFEGCEQLTDIDLSLLSTAEVTDMERMFTNCYRLKSIDLSNVNTEKVTDMIEMFYYCKALTAIDLSKFNTANVTDMKGMFRECAALTAIDVSMFDTRNVKNMEGMFAYCHGLTTLDLSDFDTENVWNTYEMFSNCSALTTIYVSDKFVTTNVTHSRYMFHACEKLKGAREYDVTKTNHSYANYTTGYFTLKLPTSINAISGNDKAEYFDINGKRGTKLQRGINLVRRGNKTYKVVVK